MKVGRAFTLAALAIAMLPIMASASCMCSAHGDPHFLMCDGATKYNYQGTGLFTMFETSVGTRSLNVQCELAHPLDGSTTAWSELKSCRVAITDSTRSCGVDIVHGGVVNRGKVSVYGESMGIGAVDKFALANIDKSLGVNVYSIGDYGVTVEVNWNGAFIAIEMAHRRLTVSAPETTQCSGMCGTCGGKQTAPDDSETTAFGAKNVCDSKKAIQVQNRCSANTNAPSTGNTANGSASQSANSNNKKYDTPAYVAPNVTNTVLNPIFESEEVLRKVLMECSGNDLKRIETDVVFGSFVEDCVMDKSLGPGMEEVAKSSMDSFVTLTEHKQKAVAISQALQANASATICASCMAVQWDKPLDTRSILNPTVTKRPEQIEAGKGVSYSCRYNKATNPVQRSVFLDSKLTRSIDALSDNGNSNNGNNINSANNGVNTNGPNGNSGNTANGGNTNGANGNNGNNVGANNGANTNGVNGNNGNNVGANNGANTNGVNGNNGNNVGANNGANTNGVNGNNGNNLNSANNGANANGATGNGNNINSANNRANTNGASGNNGFNNGNNGYNLNGANGNGGVNAANGVNGVNTAANSNNLFGANYGYNRNGAVNGANGVNSAAHNNNVLGGNNGYNRNEANGNGIYKTKNGQGLRSNGLNNGNNVYDRSGRNSVVGASRSGRQLYAKPSSASVYEHSQPRYLPRSVPKLVSNVYGTDAPVLTSLSSRTLSPQPQVPSSYAAAVNSLNPSNPSSPMNGSSVSPGNMPRNGSRPVPGSSVAPMNRTTGPTTRPGSVAPVNRTTGPTTRPGSTVAPTSRPGSTVAPTSRPGSTVAPTSRPGSTVAPTSRPGSTVAPTSRPGSTVAPTSRPGSSVAPTTRPGSSIAPTSRPAGSSVAPTTRPGSGSTPAPTARNASITGHAPRPANGSSPSPRPTARNASIIGHQPRPVNSSSAPSTTSPSTRLPSNSRAPSTTAPSQAPLTDAPADAPCVHQCRCDMRADEQTHSNNLVAYAFESNLIPQLAASVREGNNPFLLAGIACGIQPELGVAIGVSVDEASEMCRASPTKTPPRSLCALYGVFSRVGRTKDVPRRQRRVVQQVQQVVQVEQPSQKPSPGFPASVDVVGFGPSKQQEQPTVQRMGQKKYSTRGQQQEQAQEQELFRTLLQQQLKEQRAQKQQQQQQQQQQQRYQRTARAQRNNLYSS